MPEPKKVRPAPKVKPKVKPKEAPEPSPFSDDADGEVIRSKKRELVRALADEGDPEKMRDLIEDDDADGEVVEILEEIGAVDRLVEVALEGWLIGSDDEDLQNAIIRHPVPALEILRVRVDEALEGSGRIEPLRGLLEVCAEAGDPAWAEAATLLKRLDDEEE